jgi:hypothetical protein
MPQGRVLNPKFASLCGTLACGLLNRHTELADGGYRCRVKSFAAPKSVPAKAIIAAAIGSAAFGAIAVGALAIGALAIGRLAVGRVEVKRARFQRLEVGELTVRKLRVLEREEQPPAGG